MSRRLRVLMSAFACEPYQGSEPEVGWQWAVQMARFHDVTVLTQSKNRPAIERALAELRLQQPVPRFVYFDREKYLQRLRRWVMGLRLYCVLWHKGAREVVAALHRQEAFDLMHHVTIAGFRYPTAIWGHGVPSVWGPIGGIENAPVRLLPWRHLPSLLQELVRNLHNELQSSPFNILPHRLDASTVTLASTFEMQRLFEKLGCSVHVMPTIGLRTGDIPFAPRSVREGPLKLLFVGNLIALKGVHLAIEALAKSGTDATLTFIGRGHFQAALEQRAQHLGLGERIRFRGRLPREEVVKAYRDFDALVFPSFHDTGGYAVIEAMCQELPVVCLDCGGPAIAVETGSGFKVPLGSRSEVIAGLAEAMRTYDRDRRLLMAHGQKARQVVLQTYDWDKKGEQLAVVYQEAVAKWRQTGAKSSFAASGLLSDTLHRMTSLRGLVTASVVLLAIGLLSFSSVSLLKRQARQMVEDTIPGLSYAGEANFNLSQSFNRLLLILMTQDKELQAGYRVEMEVFSRATTTALARYEAAIREPEDQRLFDELSRQREVYLDTRQQLLELLQQDERAAADNLCRQTVLPAYESYKQSGEKLLNYNVRFGRQQGESILKMSQATQLLVAGVGILLFAAGFMTGYFK